MTLKITPHEEKLVTKKGLRAPHLFKLENNDLLLVFHIDADMNYPKRIAMRSSDNGETWQDDAERSYREFAYGQINDTVIAFERDTFEKEAGVFIGSYYKSEDGGKIFDGPHFSEVRINRICAKAYPSSPEHYPPENHVLHKFYGPIPEYYNPVIERSSTSTGFSFWRYFLNDGDRLCGAMMGKYFGDLSSRTVFVESKDQGKSWNYVNDIAHEHEFGRDGMTEPALRRVADGSLLCLMRRGGGHRVAQTRSLDNGLTWSEPERLVARGVDPDLYVMSDGTLVSSYGRPGQFIMFSEDKCGYSWGWHTEVTKCKCSGMSGVVELEPGKIMVVYDCVTGDAPGAGRNFDNCEIRSRVFDVEKI
ncbi:MAG: sialidase family protein [Planctomycetota bacterium]|jgi:hypothetical protein